MTQSRASRFREVSALCAAGLALVYVVYFALMLRSHVWILNGSGRPRITNFLTVWLSGASALRGEASAAYDARLMHAAQVTAAGYKFGRFFLWNYPPHYFFVAAALAALPFLSAFLVWLGGTLACYAATIGAVARSRIAALAACAAPAVFINALSGENGYLTAALIGAFLLTVERFPVVSGALLGLLTIKPQFGLLIPFVLAASGRWRVLAAASISAILCVGLAVLVFGEETFQAFVASLPAASRYVLLNGSNGWNNIQSVYGFVRWLGFDNMTAWTVQISLALSVGLAIAWLWRRPVPYPLKAAALALSCLCASPYLYIYDFVALAVPVAFLYREKPFDIFEIGCIVLANICVGTFLFFPSPVGLAGSAIVASLIARRAVQALSDATAPMLQPRYA